MNAIIHVLYQDFKDNNNLIQNLSLFDYTHNHFIITDIRNLNKNLYKNIEQIFYFSSNNFITYIKNILLFLKEIGYTSVKLCNSTINYSNLNLEDIDVLTNKLAVIDDIFHI